MKQVVAVALICASLAATGGSVLAGNDTMRSAITEVFDAVRNGDLSKTVSLQKFGVELVGDLQPLLDDGNENVRREAIALLAGIDNQAAASALVAALDDDNPGIRERAANAVLSHVLRSGGADISDPGDAINAASGKGELPGSAILLLGYSQSGENILQQSANGSRLVKTGNAGPAVPVSLPARLALSRHGDAEARASLESSFADADPNSLQFVLANIGIIDSPVLLHALAAATLGNETPTGGGVPSGVEPSRRIMDEAVIAFVKRMSLDTGFEVEDTINFTPEQIDAVKKLIAGSIPQ